ncbi:copper resistance protein CopC [Bacillus sp. DX4.1]|uniref:copper resistance CopC/CopD family protein n=1 Tax=Bacillus sp. DX4.1 TaxID=3055867 RepID=UPI0025A02D33|nr:copper resistance protein CopC [Bacillus sp. DX4.1]MDM5188176.1 copper resistance protein CopC [Bacillus sp. DX4.1]
MTLSVMKKLGVWMLMVCVFIMLVPTATSAHAYIAKATPSENETLVKAPSVVSIEFDEVLQSSSFNTLFVVDASGKRVDLKNAHIKKKNPEVMEAGVKQNIPNGTYSIQWKAISADGHPIQGVIPFSIGTPGKDSSSLQTKIIGYIPQADMIIERGLLYTSFALYIGVIFFNLLIYKGQDNQSIKVHSRSKTIIWLSLLGMMISLLLNLPLQAKINADVSWINAFHPSLLKETLKLSIFGYVWMIQIALVIILTIVTYFAIKRGNLSSFKAWTTPSLFLIGLLVTKAINSHSYGLKYREVAVAMDFLHLFAASLWIGGLAAIVLLLPKSSINEKGNKGNWSMYWDAIQRFSPWAIGAVIVILITGLFNSTFFIPTIHSLFDTRYGLALLVKVILFVGMGVLGITHFVKSRMRRKKGLGTTAKIEWGIGISILVIVAILTNSPTPPMPPTGPFMESKQLDNGYQLTLNVSPNRVGMNTFHIDLKDKNGQPVTDIEQIILTTSSLDMEMGKGTFKVPPVSPGTYQTEGMYINMTGKWNIHVHGLMKSLDSFDIDFNLMVGSR